MALMELRPLDHFGYVGLSVSPNGAVYRDGVLVKQYKLPHGYWIVNYPKKAARVHRLVAMAFIDNPLGKPEVNHIDGDKGNNSIENLEWCTRKENMAHAFSTGLCSVREGEASPAAKLSDQEISEIVNQYVYRSEFFGCSALAKRYGVDQSRIHQIVVAAGRVPRKQAIVDETLAMEIYRRVVDGKEHHRTVAADLGVSKSTVTNIASGKTWVKVTGARSADR